MKTIASKDTDTATNGLTPTARVARRSARHRWWVLAATVLTLVLAIVASGVYEPQIQDDDTPVGESGAGVDILDTKFPHGSDASEALLFSHPELGVDDPSYRTRVEALVQELRALPQVKAIITFYETGDQSLVSENGRVQRATIEIDRSARVSGHRADAILDAVSEARDVARDDGYTIAIAGNVTTEREVNKMVEEDFGRIMLISLGLGLIIMLLAFRAVVAALIPLTMAVFAIFIANGLAAVVSQSYALNESYTEMILLLGLAVGIDYSLFIVSRYRRERDAGKAKLDAITVASNTTGRAVFYAGLTVVVSLAGLMLTNHPIFMSLALGAILVVLVTIVGSLTFLPALLSVLGDKVNRLRIPFLGRVGGEGVWDAITNKVMARPANFAGITAAALIALSIPTLFLNLGFPTGSKAFNGAVSGKQAIRLLEDHFTSGSTDPAFVVVSGSDVTTQDVQAGVAQLVEQIEADPNTFFGPFETVVSPDGDALYVVVPLSGDITEAEIGVNTLRDEIVPTAFAGSAADVYVTGFAAANKDFRDYMYGKAPYVFGFVLGLAFLLLLVMFRSIVIPVKSILLNLLSVGAAYGVLVMVFQWGWGVSLLGSESSGVVLSWLPLFLFAILFGLSMDYHMLMLSRIKEAYDQGHDNDRSVATGLRLTAGQITSAAAIMVGIFSAFALGREVGLQQFGIGLGVSVLIDATVIRSILLPATMKLLGDRNWYLPNWLEWLPRVGVGEDTEEETQPDRRRTTGMPNTPPLAPALIRVDD